jgi:predicted dehydrogenase/threonine dehydrogenase-like Zn-dependent dehydrogenase
MKQLLQSLKTGVCKVVDVPTPASSSGQLLIATSCTLVSAGTERMLVDFGKANLFEKVRQQPDKVKQVLEKVRTDGLLPTLDAVRSKLDQPLALGYCNAGVVMQSVVEGFAVGDRVVSNGNHAEMVRVPQNLCAKIPDSVDDESAAFTVLAAIGLQGIRLAQPTIGEAFVVQGLGLIGLVTVQMLRANGCRVLGIDFNSARCELARQFGVSTVDLSKGEDAIATALEFSRGKGVDAVLICASTKSDEVVHQSAEMCRKRGRIVLVGVVGLNLRRDDFYKKEISFQVSASYGPGRYDPAYEDQGHDYPIGFVRWTQQRNFEAVLDMMAAGTLNVKPLITHRFTIEDAAKAYELLDDASVLGIVIEYPGDSRSVDRVVALRATRDDDKSVIARSPQGDAAIHAPNGSPRGVAARDDAGNVIARAEGPWQSTPVIGFIGAGNYASRILIPAFKQANVELDTLASSTGVSSVHHGRKAGFAHATTDLNTIWNSPRTNTVVIATRHNAHASQVVAALKVGKHVFVEKPLCLTMGELDEIRVALRHREEAHGADVAIHAANGSPCFVRDDESNNPILMVGFNRRFSPHIQKIKQLLDTVTAPKSFIMTVNAGPIPPDHWTQDPHSGGGRIIGEACHFIDLLRFLAAAPITEFDRSFMASPTRDTATITLKFADGSVGTIHYFANGSKAFPKERLEVFTAGRVLALDNFRRLSGYGWPGFSKMNLWGQDKGQVACVRAFVDSIRQAPRAAPALGVTEGRDRHREEAEGRGGNPPGIGPIPVSEILEVAEVTIKVAS